MEIEIFLLIGGAILGSFLPRRWIRARASSAYYRAEGAKREHRRGRARAVITSVEPTGAELGGTALYRIALELQGTDDSVTLRLTTALTPMQLVRVQPPLRLDITYDPDDPSNFTTELDPHFADELRDRVDRAHHPSTAYALDAPLWAIGHDGAEAWIAPPRDGDAPTIVVGAIVDGHADERERDVAAQVATVAYDAAELLALTTAMRVRVSVLVDPDSQAVAGDPGRTPARNTIRISGDATRVIGDSGITVHVRRSVGPLPSGPLPPVLSTSIAALPGALSAVLAAAKLVEPGEPPAWYGAPTSAEHAELVVDLVRQLLAEPVGARGASALRSLPAESHDAIVQRALAAALASDDGRVHLIALACAQRAARAGALTLERRVAATVLLENYAGTGHVIDLLAPSYLAAFGLHGEARRRASALRGAQVVFRSADTAYHAWLARRFG